MQTTQNEAPRSAVPAPVAIKIVGADGGVSHSIAVPKTAAEVADLRAQRSELSDQLSSATDRRNTLSAELPGTPNDAARRGIEGRIRLLDNRIVQLETDIATTGQQLSSAPAWLLATRENRSSGPTEDWSEGLGAGLSIMAVLVGVIYAFRRFRGRRGRKKETPPPMVGESAERLERLERGMESIAIEIERISEGQRFVTKLMSEQKEPARLS